MGAVILSQPVKELFMNTRIHIHTKYSLLDAIIDPEQLIRGMAERGEKALCVTEHGNVYSNVEIYKLCKRYGVKYMYGCEMYICGDVNVRDASSKYHHLVVIAKNETGRINLNKLVSQSCKYKYYGKPRIDFTMLQQHKDGLIILSACMAGEVQRSLLSGNYQETLNIVKQYHSVFGEDYYLEYQSHSDPTQQKLNRVIVALAKKLGIRFVVTTDAHYLNKEDQKYHRIFVQIGQAREVGETYNDCYIQTDEEVLSICQSTSREDNLKAIATLDEIADKCDVHLPLSAPILPHESVPAPYRSEIEYLKHLCVEGWKQKRINEKTNRQVYLDRLVYEMNAIEEMGFEGYFLFVRSYVNHVKRRGIGRGSGGGSLVNYLTHITDIDPIEYGLYFERFIDVGALQMLKEGKITRAELKIPDVDSDFGKEDRAKVLQFVANRYGRDRVASLGTFQYIWAKGAIKDIGRVLGIPFDVTNEMTSRLSGETIQEVLDLGLLDDYRATYPDLFDYASRLAGLPKSFSAHPCGKVCTMDELTYYNATDINDDGEVILQGDMHTAEDLGLVKADFLGLRTLDVIYDTLDQIGKDYEYIAPHTFNFHDQRIWDHFKSGLTGGIFQFESSGMQDTLKKIDCNSIEDLTVANALFRPGSMKFIDNYAARKQGTEAVRYIHDDLEPILKNSYGIIVYQEQLIEIGRLAGLSNPDKLRKATGKKNPKLLAEIKPELYVGLEKRGWTSAQLDELWDTMLDFARYSFNKSHAAAYAITACISMFLKTYHPREFLSAWMNSVAGKIEEVAGCANEANRMGIPIYLGKYNDCSPKTCVYKDGIMAGTNTIKFCNASIATGLMELTREQKFSSFISLLDAISGRGIMNEKQLRILIGLDFFSDFGSNLYLLRCLDLYFGVTAKHPETKRNVTRLPSLRSCKTINKEKLPEYEQYGLSEVLLERYSAKQTKKQYSGIDNVGLLHEMMRNVDNQAMPLLDFIRFEMEYLQYTTYINQDMPDNVFIVVGYDVRRDETKPFLVLRRICSGEETKTRIRQSRVYCANPFGLLSILKIDELDQRYKRKLVDGEWVATDEMELVLEHYEVIKNFDRRDYDCK